MSDSNRRSGDGQGTVSKLLLIGFFGFTVIQKIVVVAQLRAHPLTQPGAGLDTSAYAELAQRVLAGNWGLGPGLYYVSPLYIYFVSAVLALTDSYTALRVLQVVLGTLAVGGIFATAREWFGTRAAWIAAVLAAWTGLFTFYEALILQTSLDATFTSAALYLLTRALRAEDNRRAARWMLGTGAVFGLMSLNRPNALLAGAGLVAVLLLMRRARPGLLLALGLVLGMTPVAVRNAVVAHEFSFTSSHGGLNFYMGNSAGATGFYRVLPGITPTIKGQAEDARRVAERATGRAMTDAETSAYFTGLALDWMGAHPRQAAQLLAQKLLWTFHAQHVALPYSYPFFQYDTPTWLRFYVIGPWLLIPLGLVGLIVAAPHRRRADYMVWALFVPGYAAAVALFFISERYRLPLLVPLAIGAGAFVDWLWSRIALRDLRAVAGPVLAAAVIGYLANAHPIARDGRWEEGLRLAQQLALTGQFDEADGWVTRLEARAPTPGMAHEGVGVQELAGGHPDRALPHLARAVALAPGSANAHYALGQALLGVGRMAEAIPELRRGLTLGATLPMAGFHLADALLQSGDAAGAAAVVPQITIGDEAPVADWLRVGRLATEAGAPAAGERFFARAIAMAPADADARLQYGAALLVLSRFDDAIRELGESVRLDPRHAAALSHLAMAEAKTGRLDNARTHVRAALALDPDDPMARQLAAVLR